MINMKQKLLFLLALLCAVAQGVWAYDQVIDLKDWNSDVSVTATGGKYAAGKGPCPHGARGA